MVYKHLISPKTKFHRLTAPFLLESGMSLSEVQISYRTWGQLNEQGNNGILICHALTGSADADDWWGPLFGPGKIFDPSQHLIISSNILGSCYGTTGPTDLNPQTGRIYRADFPLITIRDMVNLQAELVKALGVQQLQLVVGGSLGGMQVLEWGLMYPDRINSLAIIAASGRHSPWCIGLSEAQRQAIYNDPNWQGGYYQKPPTAGLATARMIAMSTYRSWTSFSQKFGRNLETDGRFAIASYMQHQGQKLVDRFDANSYIILTKAMDSHDIARGRGEYQQVLRSIQLPTLIVAINSDILYPPIEQQELAQFIPQGKLVYLDSTDGHDAFLINMEELNDLLVSFGQPSSLTIEEALHWSLESRNSDRSQKIHVNPK